MKKNRIIFRADGSITKGYGHVMRLLSMVSMLNKKYECVFVIQKTDDFLRHQIKKICTSVIELPASDNMEREAKTAFRKNINTNDIVVLDGYNFNTSYQTVIKKLCFKLICVDDIFRSHFVSDVVINHSEGVSLADYSKEKYTKLYLGTKYAILRKSFLRTPKRKHNESLFSQSAFINMGGTDEKDYTKKALKICLSDDRIKSINIVVGTFYKFKEDLKEIKFSNQNVRIQIYSGLSERKMASLMKKSSMAICSASTVSYEYASIGGLLFIYLTASNQKNIYKFLIKSKVAYPVKQFNDILREFNDHSRKEIYFKNRLNYFSGDSDKNLVSVFEKLEIERNVTVRRANVSDMLSYFKWVNEPEVRKNSMHTSLISFKDHKSWFLKKINNKDSVLYVIEKNRRKLGQVRFDRHKSETIIDYSIDKKFRGKGYGEIVLRKSIETYVKFKKDVIKAVVKSSNVPSNRVFEKLAFKKYSSRKEGGINYNYYKLNN